MTVAITLRKEEKPVRLKEATIRRVILNALEDAWQAEIIDPEMYESEIGPDNTYADKADWLDSKLTDWMQRRTP